MKIKMYGKWICWIVFFFCKVLSYTNGADTYADETALYTTLKTGYEKDVKPSTPTYVDMFFSLRAVEALLIQEGQLPVTDEKNVHKVLVITAKRTKPAQEKCECNDITTQTLKTIGWMSMYWTDPRLAWNASDYSNISEIDINWSWRPEFFICNSADSFTFYGYLDDDVRFRVYSTGVVRWIQMMMQTTSCDVNIEKFPFDTQTCSIQLVYWGMNGIDVEANISSQVDIQSYVDNAEWQYDSGYSTTVQMPVCCPLQYYTVPYFHVTFTRLRPFYVINLIVPALLLAVCMVLTFLLPTECGERLGYSLTILLSYTVLLTITSSLMPTTSQQTPHIALFLLVLLILCSLAVVNVVLGVRIFYLESKPPSWLQKTMYTLKQFVFFECRKSSDKVKPIEGDIILQDDLTAEPQKVIPSSDEDNKGDTNVYDGMTWQKISEVQDRLCFYVYFLVTTTLTLMFFIILAT